MMVARKRALAVAGARGVWAEAEDRLSWSMSAMASRTVDSSMRVFWSMRPAWGMLYGQFEENTGWMRRK